MPKRDPLSAVGATARDRTAAMLRRLRELTKEVRMLRADIDSASKRNAQSNFKKGR